MCRFIFQETRAVQDCSMSDTVQLEAPHWAPHMCRGLKELYDEKIGCNVAIYGSDGGILDGHACVLMAASPTLKTWLAGDPIQSCHSVEIDTITCDTWRFLLDFIYSGRVKVEKDVVHEVMDAAEKLGMAELSAVCKKSLNSSSFPRQKNPSPEPVVKGEFPVQKLNEQPRKEISGNTEDKPLDLTKENCNGGKWNTTLKQNKMFLSVRILKQSAFFLQFHSKST